MCRRLSPIDSQSRALEVGADVVNDHFGGFSPWWYVYGNKVYKKMMDGNVNLMTFIQEPCQLVLMWLMTLLSEPCHGEGVLNKNDRQNLTLLTFDQEPCQLVVMWLMILPSSGCMFMVAKIKKDRQNLTLMTLD